MTEPYEDLKRALDDIYGPEPAAQPPVPKVPNPYPLPFRLELKPRPNVKRDGHRLLIVDANGDHFAEVWHEDDAALLLDRLNEPKGSLMPHPTADQLAALRHFAAQHGRTWKAHLRWAWETGYDRLGSPLRAELQQVRNTLGPSWLRRFKL